MNSDDSPQPQALPRFCKNCPTPIAKGYIGMRTGMCFRCTRAILGITEPETSSSQEKASDTNEPESSLSYQSRAEQFAGYDKGVGNSKDVGSVSTGEEINVHVAESCKRSIRPIIAKSGDGAKLTPACSTCKRAKIRCTHRRTLDASVDGSIESQAAPPVMRKKVRLRLNPEVEEKAESESNMPFSPSQRQTRGGICKRKVVETVDHPQDVNELYVEGVSGGGDGIRDTSQQHPQKQSRRGRKPRNQRPADYTEKPSNTAQAPIDEPATGDIRPPTRPSFGANPLEGAGLLSRHVVLSRELQQKLHNCDTKWLAAIDSLHEAKRTLDTWVDVWQSGL